MEASQTLDLLRRRERDASSGLPGSFVRAKNALSQDDSSAIAFFQCRVPFWGGGFFSRRAISARRVAASSCKEDFSD